MKIKRQRFIPYILVLLVAFVIPQIASADDPCKDFNDTVTKFVSEIPRLSSSELTVGRFDVENNKISYMVNGNKIFKKEWHDSCDPSDEFCKAQITPILGLGGYGGLHIAQQGRHFALTCDHLIFPSSTTNSFKSVSKPWSITVKDLDNDNVSEIISHELQQWALDCDLCLACIDATAWNNIYHFSSEGNLIPVNENFPQRYAELLTSYKHQYDRFNQDKKNYGNVCNYQKLNNQFQALINRAEKLANESKGWPNLTKPFDVTNSTQQFNTANSTPKVLNHASSATFYGPTPYLSFRDSPFFGIKFSYLHLEDFEDGLLNTPGVTANAGWVPFISGRFRDSVDADDGTSDGSGSQGSSYLSNYRNVNNDSQLLITFNASDLGGKLPTHAGIVWTDIGRNGGGDGPGSQPVMFSATDSVGNVLDTKGPYYLGDKYITGQTAEDRFFGVYNSSGISSITISMPRLNNWEVDHLQYGSVIGKEALPIPYPVLNGQNDASAGMISPVGSVATSNGYAAFNGIGNHSYHTGIDLPGENEKTVVLAADSGTVYEVVGLAHAAKCKDELCSEDEKLEQIRIWNDANNNGAVDQGELIALKETDRKFQDNHGYGITVVIHHPDQKLFTQYSHLSAIKKEIWEAVVNNTGSREINKGNPIGVVGYSENTALYADFAQHLHFEVKAAHGEDGQLTAKYPYWGYTPDIPDNYGYKDPLLAIDPPTEEIEKTTIAFRVIGSETCKDDRWWCQSIDRGTRIYSGPGVNYAVLGWTGKDQVLVANSKLKTIDTCKDGSIINRDWYRTYLPNRPGPFPTYGWVPSHRCKKPGENENVTLVSPEPTAQIINIKQVENLRGEAGENCSLDVHNENCVQVWDKIIEKYRTTLVWNSSRFAVKSTKEDVAGQTWREIYIPRIYFSDAFKKCPYIANNHSSDQTDQCVGDIATAWIPASSTADATVTSVYPSMRIENIIDTPLGIKATVIKDNKVKQTAPKSSSKPKEITRTGCKKGSLVSLPNTGSAQGALKKYSTGTDGCTQ